MVIFLYPTAERLNGNFSAIFPSIVEKDRDFRHFREDECASHWGNVLLGH